MAIAAIAGLASAAGAVGVAGGLAGTDICLARACGVLHDTGRFPQYDRYRTFRDSASVNHGALGARVIREGGALEGIASEADSNTILLAVRYHNAFRLPRLSDEASMHYIKLIRDADKLDVWRVLADHYERPEAERSGPVGQGLSESPGCNKEAVASLASGRPVPLSAARNFNDMRLLYISWAYDMNFSEACAQALSRGDLMRIALGLPDEPGISDAVGRAFDRLKELARGIVNGK